MASRYELWLLDDSGRRITLLEDMAFFSYSRTVKGFSTVLVGIPYDAFVGKIYPIFEPDRRIEVWRSAGFGIPLRREGVYLLRKPKILKMDLRRWESPAQWNTNMMDLG